MPKNVEIKARVADSPRIHELAGRISAGAPEVIHQLDTFFRSPRGRLKLREFKHGQAELIYYRRPDTSGPKISEYVIYPTKQPEILKNILAASLGIRGVVHKTRTLYMIEQTRVHIDEVEQLGSFVELEVVLEEKQTRSDGEAIAWLLMEKLEIRSEDLVEGAYLDLLGNPL